MNITFLTAVGVYFHFHKPFVEHNFVGEINFKFIFPCYSAY